MPQYEQSSLKDLSLFYFFVNLIFLFFCLLAPNVFVTVISANIYKDYEVNGKMDPYVKVTLG